MTIVTTPIPCLTAVSISWAFIRKPPSPCTAITGASGRPSLAPSATGYAKPNPPRSIGVRNVRGRANDRRSYPYAGAAPASSATIVPGDRTRRALPGAPRGLAARNRIPVPPRKQGGGHRRRTEQERPPRRRLMRSFKRTIATLAVLLLGLGAVAAQAEPQFTGSYTLDRSQSQLSHHGGRRQA